MHDPLEANPEAGDDAHSVAHSQQRQYEGYLVELQNEIAPEDRIRVWRGGDSSSEVIVSAVYGGTVESKFGQDPDESPLAGRVIEHLERITTDTWMRLKGEVPKHGESKLYRAHLTDGSYCLIEKYPTGEEISEHRKFAGLGDSRDSKPEDIEKREKNA